MLEGKGFSCDAGGNWTGGKGFRCVAFGAYTPAPPGPKREGTDPSVNTWISDGGREDSPLEAIWCRDVLLPEQSGMKGETLKWVVDHGGKGGHVIRGEDGRWGWEWLCGDGSGDGSGCVAEEQNDLQEGFFYSRQERF